MTEMNEWIIFMSTALSFLKKYGSDMIKNFVSYSLLFYISSMYFLLLLTSFFVLVFQLWNSTQLWILAKYI